MLAPTVDSSFGGELPLLAVLLSNKQVDGLFAAG